MNQLTNKDPNAPTRPYDWRPLPPPIRYNSQGDKDRFSCATLLTFVVIIITILCYLGQGGWFTYIQQLFN